MHASFWRFLGVAEHQMTLDNEHKEREEWTWTKTIPCIQRNLTKNTMQTVAPRNKKHPSFLMGFLWKNVHNTYYAGLPVHGNVLCWAPCVRPPQKQWLGCLCTGLLIKLIIPSNSLLPLQRSPWQQRMEHFVTWPDRLALKQRFRQIFRGEQPA